jgi:hypothetical protein
MMEKANRFELEILAMQLYQMDKGPMRQWAGIEPNERIRYRSLATDLLLEDSYAAQEVVPQPVIEVKGDDLTISDEGFEGVLATRKKPGRPKK